MRRGGKGTIAAAIVVLAMLAPAPPGAAAAEGSVVRIVASNFRFCLEAPCEASDQAYVRTDSGRVTDNAAGTFVEVRPGDTVEWSYEDTSCDDLVVPLLTCPGHEVQFEPGQTVRGTVGTMPARQGPQSITWTVPGDARPGDVLRYYCDLSDHWRLGVTGGLVVTGG